MIAAKRIFIVALLTVLALLPLAGNVTESSANYPANFQSYGFGYVKVTNLKTKKAFYLVDDQIHTHCCGDVAQYTQFIKQVSKAALRYIDETLNDSPDNYNLNPTFTKCLRSETEAESIRSKKALYFQKLGNKAIQISMGLPDMSCN